MIAVAIRSGTTWDDYKRQNNIYEGRELFRAVTSSIKNRFSR